MIMVVNDEAKELAKQIAERTQAQYRIEKNSHVTKGKKKLKKKLDAEFKRAKNQYRIQVSSQKNK